MRVKTIMKDGDYEFKEMIEVTSLEKAEEEIKGMLKEFNEEEKARYGNKARPRELVRVIKEDTDKGLTHKWFKEQMIIDEEGTSLWRCKNCGLGIQGHLRPSPSECYPDRTCKECNKVFKSVKNYEKHLERIHNLTL